MDLNISVLTHAFVFSHRPLPNTTTVVAVNEADALIQAKKARFETVEDLFNDLEKNS